ncbi:MAG: single-stranded-DNA-specific exonuclease RecJ [Lachnospiraceae bacterium]|nr:single-stranded-DNA-specific exonuclease RecJ [Lachnospiraceae bacterium]
MKNWVVINKRADFKALGTSYGIDPVVARVMINRGVKEEDFGRYLHPSKEDLHDPCLMKDMDRAVSFIADHMNEKIRVIGDYDVDGINSTYILLSAIRSCGGNVDYRIPRRVEDGYGINPRMVEEAAADGVKIIITCDNGIAAFPAAERAKELGIIMLITDHHQIPFEEVEGEKREHIPEAYAVINPHQKDCPYPFKEICGGMVAWKFMIRLFERFQKPVEEAFSYIENAAFATVGDIMPLQDENRTVVKLGLKAMEHTKNIGLRALLAQTGLQDASLTAYHIGFVLGPCFNATGRLETADMALSLLCATDEGEAIRIASELVAINEERKSMTKRGDEEAVKQLEESGLKNDKVLVLYIPKLHESLCGLVAGHIKEKYNRPTFVLSDGADCVKGSGRSVEAYSMFEKMNACGDLLEKFGGHPMAAGLSIKKENIDAFRRRMNEEANLSESDLTPKEKIDVPMPLSYISMELIEQLNMLEPYGNANEKPVFAEKDVAVKSIRTIGKEGQYLKFVFLSGGIAMDGLYFGDAETLREALIFAYAKEDWENALNGRENNLRMSLLYEPQINEFRGRKTLQIVVKDFLV